MKRSLLIACLKVAGYHDDQREFLRYYTGHRISFKAAQDAYQKGRELKNAGMPCNCVQCKNKSEEIKK